MAPINGNETRPADAGEARETGVDTDGGESTVRRAGRRALRRSLLLLGTAVGVRVGVSLLRRRRRPEREFTRIELDADPGER